MLLKMAWSNLQREVFFHFDMLGQNVDPNKVMLSEDDRLVIMAYLLCKIELVPEIFIVLKTIECFINFEVYEEAAPVSTIETALHIILLEYTELFMFE
jgi:hypothetical protein